MREKLLKILKKWPKDYITGSDLQICLATTKFSLFSLTKRFVKDGLLIRLKRDLFIISDKVKESKPNSFSLAALIYGPSYVSFETALSFHGWIPEAVVTTTSSTSKRSRKFETQIGVFTYSHIPKEIFSIGVEVNEMNQSNVLIANPWKAVADLIYIKKKIWENINQLSSDLRIELEYMQNSNIKLLEKLASSYPSQRVQKTLKGIYKGLEI